VSSPAGGQPPDRWRFLDSGAGPGLLQMAIDEALLLACARGLSPPTLRVFAFRPPCLSLGRFQPAGPWEEACRALGLEVVRRPTGGGAVLHAGDVCYAVVAPLDDPAVGGPLRRSYCQISLALRRFLEALGAPSPEVCEAEGRAASRAAACFALAGPYEVTVRGAKVIGSAQLRRRGVLLQQGAIRTERDGALEARLFPGLPPAPGLHELLGRPLAYQEVAAALRDTFAEALGLTLTPAPLSAEERELCRTVLASARESLQAAPGR